MSSMSSQSSFDCVAPLIIGPAFTSPQGAESCLRGRSCRVRLGRPTMRGRAMSAMAAERREATPGGQRAPWSHQKGRERGSSKLRSARSSRERSHQEERARSSALLCISTTQTTWPAIAARRSPASSWAPSPRPLARCTPRSRPTTNNAALAPPDRPHGAGGHLRSCWPRSHSRADGWTIF